MRQTVGFLFFMLFLAGFAFVTLKNLRSAESLRNANDNISIISGAWIDPTGSTSDDRKIAIRFHPDGKISGFAGCNRFFGTFVATDSTLEVGPLGTTRMACPGGIMRQESAFLGQIEAAIGYRIDGRTMTITVEDGSSLTLNLTVSDDN